MTRFLMMLIMALPLVAAAPLLGAPAARERFGDFTYDASVFVVEGDGPFVVRSRRRNGGEPVLTARIEAGSGSDCSAAKLGAATADRWNKRNRAFETIRRDGFEIHIVSFYLGCRNARPPSVTACTAYRGRVYRFSNEVHSCRGGPGFGVSAGDFLGSLAVAP